MTSLIAHSLYAFYLFISFPAYWSFFLFISGYAVSLVLAPEARVLDRLWLSLGLSLGLLVIISLLISLVKSVFQIVLLIDPYWTILTITACSFLVYIKRKIVKTVRKEVLR